MKKPAMFFLIGIITYSIVAFAYMHDRFITKDIFLLIHDRLNRIELKLDKVIESDGFSRQ